VNNKNSNEVPLTVQPVIVEHPQVSPAVISPLLKEVQTEMRKRISKSPKFLSSSLYKNALLATRKEPSNNKQGRKTLHYDGPSVASTFSDSCRRREN
jgi:hypothetical protein